MNVATPMPETPQYDIRDVGLARLRKRHYVLIGAFVVMVIIPTLMAAFLSWNFAGSLRKVTASVTVQEHSLGSFGDGESASSKLQTAFKGSGGEETAIVRQLVLSEDFYRTIRDQIDLSRIWPEDRLVPYLPTHYDPNASSEVGHDFWRNMVAVHLGSRDQIIRVSVTAFDQQSAEEVLRAIRVEAERRLNLARTATLRAAITEAERRVEELRVKSDEDRKRLTEFRLQNRTVDPVMLLGLDTEFKTFLRSMQASEEIRLAEIEGAVASEQELTRAAADRLAAIRAFLNDPTRRQGKLATRDEITDLIATYQPLLTEAELSGLSLRMAELSILRYNQELESTKVFLSSVTGGSMASIELFPQFWPTLLIVAMGSLVLWIILLLTFYGIRDRK
ncbi:hypothetical protein [Paracoccus sp. S1E-3]|uniref:hypothetical protein n=1 Tax=Paracoccus sp. S1E-3 TaxID=2756130 RepID=UPI0015EF50E6|nr:hypothetical protein [Paracoccus sp. S1E-3]MBA4492186.1 hypothetical protein [Paracoccus sp. S1E-3]